MCESIKLIHHCVDRCTIHVACGYLIEESCVQMISVKNAIVDKW